MYNVPSHNTLPNSYIASQNDIEQIVAIIPAYNESRNIINIISQVSKYVNKVIVIDDGSLDDTYSKAVSTDAQVIRNNRNAGKGAALRKGILESFKLNPTIIITIDADGQHDPADIPKLLIPIKEKEADIVIGSRYHADSKREIPLKRGMGLSIINSLNRSLNKSFVKDSQSGFRAYNRTVFPLIADIESGGYGAETEQLALAENYGMNITEVPVAIRYKGLLNTSKKNSITHGLHVVSTIIKIAIEKRPLQIFGCGGLILILISLIPIYYLMMIFNDTRYFSIPLSLIALGLIFNGALLVVISFILYALKRIRQKLSNF